MLTVLVIIETVILALFALLLVALLRSHAELLRRVNAPTEADLVAQQIQELQANRPTTGYDIVGETLAGEPTTIPVCGTEGNSVLVFLSSGCLTCHGIWRALGELDRSPLPTGTQAVVVTKSRNEESIPRPRKLASPGTPVVLSSEAWDQYKIPGSPYFVYCEGASGAIKGEGSANSWPQIVSLLEESLEDEAFESAVLDRARITELALPSNNDVR
jgi:hypothetical protein